MDHGKMNPNPSAIPTPFRGLRILLLDNHTPSLLEIASNLEAYSYTVTTTQVPTIALSILQERMDQFDLLMADINMPHTDCFNFMKSVHAIKNLPIILMSAELKKDMVEEAMTKGACFFLKKPISSKNLKNVWQHVYRNNKYEKSRSRKAEMIKQEAESPIKEKEKNVHQIVNEGTSPGPGNEQIGDSDEKDIGGVDEKRLTVNNKAGKLERKRTEEEGINNSNQISRLSGESADFHIQVDRTTQLHSTTFMKLLLETDTIDESNFCEDSHLQTKLSMDLVKESGSSTSFAGEKE